MAKMRFSTFFLNSFSYLLDVKDILSGYLEKQVNSKTGSGLSTKMLAWVLCNSGSIGQNLQNELSVERPVLPEFVIYTV